VAAALAPEDGVDGQRCCMAILFPEGRTGAGGRARVWCAGRPEQAQARVCGIGTEPARSGSGGAPARSLYGLVDGWWVVPHPSTRRSLR